MTGVLFVAFGIWMLARRIAAGEGRLAVAQTASWLGRAHPGGADGRDRLPVDLGAHVLRLRPLPRRLARHPEGRQVLDGPALDRAHSRALVLLLPAAPLLRDGDGPRRGVRLPPMEARSVPGIRRLLGRGVARDLCLGAREGSLAHGPSAAAADDPRRHRPGEPLARPRARSSRALALAAVVVLLAVNASAMVLACFRYGAYDLDRSRTTASISPTSRRRTTWSARSRCWIACEDARAGRPAADHGLRRSVVAADLVPARHVRRPGRTRIDRASTPVIVADWDPEGALEKQLADKYTREARADPRVVVPREMDREPEKPERRPTLGDVFRWWLDHRLWSPIGSQDATFFVRKDLARGPGALAPLELARPGHDRPRLQRRGAAPRRPSVLRVGRQPADGQLAEPRGLAVDGRGNLYVADTKNSRIQVFDANGPVRPRSSGTKGRRRRRAQRALRRRGGRGGRASGSPTRGTTGSSTSRPTDGSCAPSAIPRTQSLRPARGRRLARSSLYVADTGNKRSSASTATGRRLNEFGGTATGPGSSSSPSVSRRTRPGNSSSPIRAITASRSSTRTGSSVRQFPAQGWKDFYTEPYLAIGPGDAVIVDGRLGRPHRRLRRVRRSAQVLQGRQRLQAADGRRPRRRSDG